MAVTFGGTFPVLPGKEDRVRNFEQELAPLRAEWDRLCEETGFIGVTMLLQQTPNGYVATYVNEVEDPTKVRLSFTDSEYDQWWVAYFKDVHGVDMTAIAPEDAKPPAETAFVWRA